jgi:formamidopyrimidine-DNA glycosylase
MSRKEFKIIADEVKGTFGKDIPSTVVAMLCRALHNCSVRFDESKFREYLAKRESVFCKDCGIGVPADKVSQRGFCPKCEGVLAA